ncbi:THUMP domain-containing protein [Anaeromyxobacter terrae]|uniref:THUMP domain-containing protein n=1 Tax=Anaeromyxobacter terrae TaxID=2925406 RepID=UPI001F56599F|nr:THUMP domain-containing protein [Anaeromyxobacter sp. SG22]
MRDWNVVVTVQGGGYNDALRLLRSLARVEETRYYNVLVAHADDPRALLATLRERAASDPAATASLARVTPVETVFTFSSPEEFEARAREATARYAPVLAGRSFHVRVHRRGMKSRLSGLEEERVLAEGLLDRLAASGQAPRITFHDPDYVLDVETIGSQAGVALFSREELEHHPLLRPG